MTAEETKDRLYQYYISSYDSIIHSDGDMRKLKGWVKYLAYKYATGTSDSAVDWEDICDQVVYSQQFEKWVEYPATKWDIENGKSYSELKYYLNRAISGYAVSWVKGIQHKRENEYNEATLSMGVADDDNEVTFSVENFSDETDETTSILKEPVAEEYEKTKLWTDVIEALRRNNIRALSRDDYLTLIKYKAENPKATLEQIHDKFGMNLSTMNNVQNRIRSDEIMIKTIKKNYGYLIPEDLEEQEKNWTAEKLEAKYGTPANPVSQEFKDQFKGNYRGTDHPYIIETKTIKPGDEGYDALYNAIKNTPDHGETIYFCQ